MLVIGVDPGTLVTGYGLVSESSGKWKCHGWGAIKASKGAPMPRRMRQIADGLREIIKQAEPECLALEQSFFAKDAQSALKLGQVRGVIMLVAEEFGVSFAEYSPLKIKQTVSGYGKADKTQVRAMVQRLLSLKEPPTPLDASDALAIAITHLSHSRLNRRGAS